MPSLRGSMDSYIQYGGVWLVPSPGRGMSSTMRVGAALTCIQHIALPLFLPFVLGSMLQSSFTVSSHRPCHAPELTDPQALNTLLTDLSSCNPATAQASCNLLRCLLAAGGTSVIQVLISHIGPGFTFMVLAAIASIVTPLLLLEARKGKHWRELRARNKAERDVPSTGTSIKRTENANMASELQPRQSI